MRRSTLPSPPFAVSRVCSPLLADECVITRDTFGLRVARYPVAFRIVPAEAVRLMLRLERDGWHKVVHWGAVAAYQDIEPVIPFINGVDGRRHVVLLPLGGVIAVTTHVDRGLLTGHEADPVESAKFTREFRERYGGR